MDDNQIIQLYHARSESAIQETESKYGRYCHSVAYGILHDSQDADECVNDTYLRAWNAMPPKWPRCLRTFLGKITRNVSLDLWDKRSAEKRGNSQVQMVLDELLECIPSETMDDKITDDLVIRDTDHSFDLSDCYKQADSKISPCIFKNSYIIIDYPTQHNYHSLYSI